jgi:hypothetical protein
MKLYCYDGDVKKLIPAGWKFQKLYASNYKSYSKNNIIMFVVGGMVIEIDNIDHKYQADLIDFILDHKDEDESFWHSKRDNSFFKDTFFANWVVQNGVVLHHTEATYNKIKWYNALENNEDVPYLEDGYPIRYDFVKTILELDSLGKLVKVDK